MKYALLIISIITLISCGSNEAEIARQKHQADSIALEKLDSIKSAQKIEQLQAAYSVRDSSKNELQKKYDAVLTRLDSLTANNTSNDKKLVNKQADILKLKSEIAKILLKTRLSEAESRKVIGLIYELDDKVQALK